VSSPVAWRQGSNGDGPFLHGLRWIDVTSGREQRFDFGDGVLVEEHVVVPRPGRSGERDAWLLGTAYDARRDATLLNLFDAARVGDGPIAQAVLPYALPLGFHGNFAAA
jgi:carotenoid cleavage dioxygenase